MKRSIFMMPLISAIYLTFASCQPSFLTFDGQTWGTSCHIVYSSDSDLSDSIVAVMRAVDGSLSMFNDSSEISAINRGEDRVAGPMIREVFDIAGRTWEVSGGMYDPTVGRLSEIWGFGKADIASAPSDSIIAATLESVGLGDCSISPEGRVIKKSPTTRFDFSSIAKGYGVDLIGAMFERNGVEDYMIEIGGEILAKGTSPRNKKWRIQIDAPVEAEAGDDLHTRYALVELGPDRTAIASSGNYRNLRSDSTGHRWGHTLSPLDGRPVESRVLATSIIGPSCGQADALATAAMAMEPDSAAAAIESLGYEGLIISQNGSTGYNIESTKKFSNFIVE